MTRPLVYLAGPVSGLSFGQATDWREWAIAELYDVGIQALSPLRGKEYLAKLKNISCTGEEYVHMGVLSTPKAVIMRDRFDCTRSDLVLVNLLNAATVSIGTVMEMAWADMNRIPIVCAIEPNGNPHEHMMLQQVIGMRTTSLEEAVHLVKATLI
jgi:nucleoside 2-deoxyribosyltransferase